MVALIMASKSKLLLCFTAVSLLVTSDLSVAAEQQLRKKSFFERLFETKPRPKPKTETKRRRNFFDFLNSDSQRNSDIDIVYGGDNSRVRNIDNSDPEPFPMIGMGNLEYAPPLQVPLYDAAFGKLPPLAGDAELIRISLSDKRSPIRTTVPHRKAILEAYKARNFAPIWIADHKPTPRAEALMQTLAGAGQDGLEPLAYLPYGLNGWSSAKADATNLSPEDIIRFDISLTAAMLRYAQNISNGQFEPARLSEYNDIAIAALNPDDILRVAVYTPYVAEYLAGLEPEHPAYALLKAELAALNSDANNTDYKPFPTGRKLVKVGQIDERIPELRSRMADLGFLEAGDMLVAEDKLELLDKALSKAIKGYQTANGIKLSGQLDMALVAKLNEDPTRDKRNKVISSLERVRWLPRDLGNRHVFVNQAAFQAKVVENDKTIWTTKVIVGRPMTQTAAFHDEFETVVFNPSWGVPQSIIVNEYLPKLRRDPGYLDRIGYKVTNESGKPVSSRNVDWWAYGNEVPFSIQQPPGSDNALGELKFLFPNEHAIYMHDTPTRKLFKESGRAFSHGCVRVEDPRQFASILLGWDRDRVSAGVETGESYSEKIPLKTKVHLTYFAAWPDETGKIQYYSDIYERDKTLISAYEKMSEAFETRLQQRLAGTETVESDTVPQ
jgi:L,D-transpeptidase YcbB